MDLGRIVLLELRAQSHPRLLDDRESPPLGIHRIEGVIHYLPGLLVALGAYDPGILVLHLGTAFVYLLAEHVA